MYTIIDTGSSALIFSEYYFEYIIKLIFDYVGDDEYVVKYGYVFTRCYRNFPNLYFMFDNQWIEVTPDEYVWDTSTAQDRSQCVLLMSQTDAPMNIFGMPLFHGYYTIHDMQEGRIGYVPNAESKKTPLEKADPPVKTLDKKGRTSKIVLIATILAAMTVGLTLAYNYGVKPGLDGCFPNKTWIIATLSGLYFLCVGLLEGFVIEPVLESWLKLATANSNSRPHEVLLIARVTIWLVAILVYIPVAKSYMLTTPIFLDRNQFRSFNPNLELVQFRSPFQK